MQRSTMFIRERYLINPFTIAFLLLGILLLFVARTAIAYEEQELSFKDEVFLTPALGLTGNFGRWTDIVPLVYDPDDAPDEYADTDHFMTLLQIAAREWEMVSGIRFQLLASSDALEDEAFEDDARDGDVRVYWTSADFRGQSSPNRGPYDYDLGYWPYFDGYLALNKKSGIFRTDYQLVRVLIHELGHLLGLGHSDNPRSVMFANPYNSLVHPREDDIRVVQTLYGEPAIPISVSAAQSQWLYSPPPDATAPTLLKLLQVNKAEDVETEIVLTGSNLDPGFSGIVAEINTDTPDSLDFRFRVGGFGSGSTVQDLDILTKWIFVDPMGYVYKTTDFQIQCAAGVRCRASVYLTLTEIIKSVPGKWMMYIIDDTSDPEHPVTLVKKSWLVDTNVETNSPPRVAVSVEPGQSATSLEISLDIEDSEGSDVTVYWNPPGKFDFNNNGLNDVNLVDIAGSGENVVREIDFYTSGEHSLYIEVEDNSLRYEDLDVRASVANSGDGYQTLIRIDVSLPYETEDDIKIVSNQSVNTWNKSETLDWIASRNALSGMTSIDSEGSEATIFASVTANGGATYMSEFSANENVIVAGKVIPETADIGRKGEIFIVLYDGDNKFYYRDLNGIFQLWNANMSTLEPAYEVASLASSNPFEVYQGLLKNGRNRVFIGYALTENGALHFNTIPLRVDVFEL